MLAEMESQVANVRVRATGTLGGNLCFAEPHSDPATLLLVLGGTVRVEGSAGMREIPGRQLIAGAYASNLHARTKFLRKSWFLARSRLTAPRT